MRALKKHKLESPEKEIYDVEKANEKIWSILLQLKDPEGCEKISKNALKIINNKDKYN